MRGLASFLLLISACPHAGGSGEPAASHLPVNATSNPYSNVTEIFPLPPPPASAPPAAASVSAAPPDKQQQAVAVTQLCVEPDGTIVVDNDCGCNDALLCTAELAGETVSVIVRTDPSRMRTCDDCFRMVPGRCALPVMANGKITIRAGALEVRADVLHGKLAPPQRRSCAR
jgi:hypothetical protein